MCCQLFQLEENIKSQRQLLSNLEFDLQKELNTNTNTNGGSESSSHHSHNNNIGLTSQLQQLNLINSNNDVNTNTPEIDEFRKEVNMRYEWIFHFFFLNNLEKEKEHFNYLQTI
jgi:hypothetical protein